MKNSVIIYKKKQGIKDLLMKFLFSNIYESPRFLKLIVKTNNLKSNKKTILQLILMGILLTQQRPYFNIIKNKTKKYKFKSLKFTLRKLLLYSFLEKNLLEYIPLIKNFKNFKISFIQKYRLIYNLKLILKTKQDSLKYKIYIIKVLLNVKNNILVKVFYSLNLIPVKIFT